MPQTPKQLNCRFCGKLFDRNNNVQKYCSDECRIDYWRNDPESQARAKEYRSSPEAKARANARSRERYHTDAAYRERTLAQSKKWYDKRQRRQDPEVAAKQREYQRQYRKERYRTDAAYRERVRQDSKEQYAKRRLDPEFKAKQREYGRRYRERKKLERSQGTEPTAASDSSDL